MKNANVVLFGIVISALTGLASHAASFQYICNPANDNTLKDKITIIAQGEVAMVNGKKFTLDTQYRPQAANVGYNRYLGDTSIIADEDGYNVEVLIKKNMSEGVQKSSIKIRARGDDFFNNYYSCFIQ